MLLQNFPCALWRGTNKMVAVDDNTIKKYVWGDREEKNDSSKQQQSATMYQQICVTKRTSASTFFFFFYWHLPMCISIIHSNPLCGTQSLYSVGWDKGKAADNTSSVYLRFVTKKFIKNEHATLLSSTEATATAHTRPYNVWKQLSTCSAGRLKRFEPQYMPEKPFPCTNCLADFYEAIFDTFVNIQVLKWTLTWGLVSDTFEIKIFWILCLGRHWSSLVCC